MAPGTSIGAAHPVGLGPSGGPQDEAVKQKLENFAAGYLEAIAARRHRNTAWALASVRESATLTADQARAQGVVDLVARDLPDLLAQLDGREAGGRVLRTAGAATFEVPWSLRERVLQVLAHPQVMLILMLVVMYGLIGELTSPGALLPGVSGAIALVLLLYLASVLPMNAAGLALVAVAIALFVLDAFTPTHGVLTVGGAVAFFLGTLMLFDRGDPFLRLSLAWLVPATGVTALFFLFVVGAGIRAQQAPAKTGAEALIGQRAQALEAISPAGGRVAVEGEIWAARSPDPIGAGQPVEIVGREGLTLAVRPCASKEVRS
jgi:membrane-bound serine protease (ClpP class)